MRTLAEDFQMNGSNVLSDLREINPEAYLRIIISILPKSLIKQWEETPNVNYDDITEEEFRTLVHDIQRRKSMQQVIETVSK